MGLQNRVFAWAAAAMLAEEPLATLVAGKVRRVGAQIGYPLDDVGVETEEGNFALFQVKAGLRLGQKEDSPLADALGQAVEQYTTGTLPVSGGEARAVDPGRDALVVCTDASASRTVKEDLRRAVRRAGQQPDGSPMQEGMTAAERRALEVALVHIGRAWRRCAGEPTDDEIRRFLRALRVLTVDACDGEVEHTKSLALLSTSLGGMQAAR